MSHFKKHWKLYVGAPAAFAAVAAVAALLSGAEPREQEPAAFQNLDDCYLEHSEEDCLSAFATAQKGPRIKYPNELECTSTHSISGCFQKSSNLSTSVGFVPITVDNSYWTPIATGFTTENIHALNNSRALVLAQTNDPNIFMSPNGKEFNFE